MQRRCRTVTVAALLLLFTAVPVSAMPDGGVPLKGGTTGVDSMSDPTGICDPIPIGSDLDANWRYDQDGSGQLSHLGRVAIHVEHCSYVDWDTGAGTFGNGTITYTAANGDTLVIAQSGTFQLLGFTGPIPTEPDASSVISGTWVVVSGTGRFDGASGSGVLSGLTDIFANTTSVSMRGKISYNG